MFSSQLITILWGQELIPVQPALEIHPLTEDALLLSLPVCNPFAVRRIDFLSF